jgi:hypothetical protein
VSARVPWVDNPNRGRLPHNEVFREEDDRADVCPYCGRPLSKQYQYFSFDLGHNIRVKDCVRCGVTLYQQPRSIIKDVAPLL